MSPKGPKKPMSIPDFLCPGTKNQIFPTPATPTAANVQPNTNPLSSVLLSYVKEDWVLSIALRLMIQSCLLQKYSWSALNWVLRRKLGRLIRRCVFWTHYDPWNLIWIQPLHLFLGSASMLPSDAGIHGNIWWRLQGSWGPRDQSEAKFGPDWSSGSISWALVSLEAPYNVTLDACVQGSYAGSGVSWYTCLPSESLSHRDHFRKEFVFHVSTNSSQEGYGGAKQGSQRTCANQISLVPQHFQEVKRWMPTLWK